jgi:hypothetical protein
MEAEEAISRISDMLDKNFSRPGVKDKMGNPFLAGLESNLKSLELLIKQMRNAISRNNKAEAKEIALALQVKAGQTMNHVKAFMTRPGQPERFDMEGACWEGYEPVGTKQKDGKTVPNCVPMKNAAGDEEEMASGPFTREQDARLAAREEKLRKQRAKKALEDYKTAVREEERYAGSVFVTPRRMAELEARTQAAYEEAKRLNPEYKGFSRPGQPEKFAASDDRASDFLRRMSVGVTPSNIQQMQILASQALAYGQGRNDRMLIDEAKALQSEIIALKKAGH